VKKVTENIIEVLEETNEEALLADGFEDALIGTVQRFGMNNVALYDYPKCIKILEKQGMKEDEAIEFFEYNVVGAWMGDGTPAFANIMTSSKEK